MKPDADCTCPLRLHQAKTYAEVTKGSADIIFNTATTADGKSLAAYLPGLLDPNFRIMSLYPTIELVTDQERQIRGDPERQSKGYLETFHVEQFVQVDSLYGAELARRVEGAGKGAKFKELWRSLKHQSFILTNPDIFHLIA
ncbi:MAG TPA: DEAD/DEAH box helicase, partial [Allocoleopsis sp.]